MHLSKPKLNFGGYLNFESIFEAFKPDDFVFYLIEIASFDKYSIILATFCLRFAFACRNFGLHLFSLCKLNSEIPFK